MNFQFDSRVGRWLGFIPAAIIFPIMFWTLSDNLSLLFQETIEFRFWLLSVSAILLVGYFVSTGIGWWFFICFFGGRLSLLQAVRISALSMLGKYIPGKIWTVAGKIYMANYEGVSNQITYVASLYEFIVVNISGIIVFFIFDFFSSAKILKPYFIFIIALFASILIVFPNAITWFLNHTLRIVKQPLVTISLKRSQLSFVLLYYMITWLLCGYSYSLFVWGFFPDLAYAQLTSSLVLSYIVGFVAIFAPGGVGIREGTMASLLIMYGVTSDVAIFVSLCSRVWSTAGELILILPLYFIRRDIFKV